MRSRAPWRLIHGQRPRECEVSRYRHGCDPPKPAGPILDCDPVPSSPCCLSHPHFSPSGATRLLPMFLRTLAVGCSTPPTYEEAFSVQHEIKGTSDSIPTPLDVTWGCIIEILAQRGWLIQQADTKGHVILAHRDIRDKEEPDVTDRLSFEKAECPLFQLSHERSNTGTNREVIEFTLVSYPHSYRLRSGKPIACTPYDYNGYLLKHDLTIPLRAIERWGRRGPGRPCQGIANSHRRKTPWTLINSNANGYSSKVH